MNRIDVLRELAERPCLLRASELRAAGVLSLQDVRGLALPYLNKYPDSVVDLFDTGVLSNSEERHYALQAVKMDAHIGIFFCKKGILHQEEVKPFALDYLVICPWTLDEFSGIVNKGELELHIVKNKLAELLSTYGVEVVEQALGEIKSQQVE